MWINPKTYFNLSSWGDSTVYSILLPAAVFTTCPESQENGVVLVIEFHCFSSSPGRPCTLWSLQGSGLCELLPLVPWRATLSPWRGSPHTRSPSGVLLRLSRRRRPRCPPLRTRRPLRSQPPPTSAQSSWSTTSAAPMAVSSWSIWECFYVCMQDRESLVVSYGSH